jgi:tRNA-2-methylthio-N6-dimethylallyladenosine synthase
MDDLVQLRRSSRSPAAEAGAGGRLAYVETYGCQMNVADAEMVLGMLHVAGYGRTDDPGRADLILINTCAVREKAEERVFARASELARERERAGVVLGITGCMAEHLKGEIRRRAPYVDLVVGPDGYRPTSRRRAPAARWPTRSSTATRPTRGWTPLAR